MRFNILFIIISISCILASSDRPKLFQFNQGTFQAFYFFKNVTIDSINVDADDWVGTFNCTNWNKDSTACTKLGPCVGCRKWNTANCGGGVCDLPAIGAGGESLEITKENFGGRLFSGFKRGFTKGDILFLIKAKPEKLKIGDTIAFNSGTRNVPVIHRIIKIQGTGEEITFTTIGDNNEKTLDSSNNAAGVDEREIKSDQLVGKAAFRVAPWLGWGKLIFFERLKQESERGICKEN